MNRARFELALERLDAPKWKRFEEFASAFLTTDYSKLRTVAAPSGDDGRDAELFSSEGDAEVVLQYSVTKDWSSKIQATVKRIQAKLPAAKVLVYVTNQSIGAAADALKRDIRARHKLTLDVLDKSFFLDRFEGDDHREAVAENLAKEIVDPYLAGRGIIERKAQALSSLETQAAHLYLALQWEDDTRDKGLTSLAFDALVRSALRDTDVDHRLKRADIHAQVASIVETHHPDFVARQVDNALARLTKKVIRHHAKEDEFCLTHEERTALNVRLATIERADDQLSADITAVVVSQSPPEGPFSEQVIAQTSFIARKVIERFLLSRGEAFASAVSTGQVHQLGLTDIREFARAEVEARADLALPAPKAIDLAVVVAEHLLLNPSEATARYVRDISDAYTLLAFLKQTPDVQSAIKKMFSAGEIWLDTSILLPWFAEDVLPAEKWKFRLMLSVAREVGLKLFVTRGVIEEVERHMNRSLSCANQPIKDWRGAVPFLFSIYVESGRGPGTFRTWVQTFRGFERPEDDIADYLRDNAGVVLGDLSGDVARASSELQTAVKEVWIQIHEARRGALKNDFDPMLALRLADHDRENYLGVVGRRTKEVESAFGYTSWWLTIDHMAFSIKERIDARLGIKSPASPVMSADFLINYLAFGPVRGKAARHGTGLLPVALDPSLVEYLTPELLEIANTVRRDSEGLPENVIRRRVRDALDKARRRVGDIGMRGVRVLSDALAAEVSTTVKP